MRRTAPEDRGTSIEGRGRVSVLVPALLLLLPTVPLAGCGQAPGSPDRSSAVHGDASEAGSPDVEITSEGPSNSEGPGIEARLAEMGLELPELSPPVANYVRAVRTGDLVFLAGHGPLKPDGTYITGKVDSELSVEEGYEAARRTALALLASLEEEIGDLDRVQRIVRVFGMVNSDSDFTRQPQVINGCSDLLVELFGERGRHARAAVGMASLPLGIAVEIEMVVEVE